MQFVVWRHPEITAHLPGRVARALLSVDKGGLHPFRLLSILALAWVVSRLVPAGARWCRSRWAAPFVLCGQHSLPVFCAGIFLSFLGRLVMEETDGWWVQAVVNVVGAGAAGQRWRMLGVLPGEGASRAAAACGRGDALIKLGL